MLQVLIVLEIHSHVLLKFLCFTVEAYKKGIMKGGAAIPPPGNLPGSKFQSLNCPRFFKRFWPIMT